MIFCLIFHTAIIINRKNRRITLKLHFEDLSIFFKNRTYANARTPHPLCVLLAFQWPHPPLSSMKVCFLNDPKVKLVFTSEKLRCAFSTKDPYQSEHLSKVVYKFVSASCNASFVCQTCQHLATRIDEHFRKDKKSHIYQHI